ncbi:MAG: hypothetical protein COS89_09895 [Deltaproteobacteria bacterium CG07_land_8_20_14_0_80_38_7]|nr:MAG: hypothetical protein COS89_09895 [Deltaproteobacteria bacterium CG07_land_8_20_14_0_80_38_7]
MNGFIDSILQFQFMKYALIAGLLCSISCGIIGSYIVVRRITYIAGGIAHSTLGGMGAARFLQVNYNIDWCTPTLGAVIAALIAALIIGMVSLRAKQREDTVISAIWAIGMAAGILFISQTPGYSEDLMNYLFGNILMVTQTDIYIIAILDALIIVLCFITYKPLLAICFDEEFARVKNINVELYQLLLLLLTALTVVLLTIVVGIVMVIALLAIPAAIAGRLTQSLLGMMAWAIILSGFFTSLGLKISFDMNMPTGSIIIMVAGITYLISILIKKPVKKLGHKQGAL